MTVRARVKLPNSIGFRTFVQDERRLTIPKMQRKYDWTKDNVIQLWDDLFSDARADDYYLGNLVYFVDEKEGLRCVVDGQQRLATLTVLLCAVRDSVEQRFGRGGEPKFQDWTPKKLLKQIEQLIRTQLPTEVPRLILRGPDERRFNHILEKGDEEPRPDGQGVAKIYRAYDVLRQRADATTFEDLAQLVTGVSERVHFTTVEAPSLMPAFTIFTTINARGKDLNLADLVRAFLLERAQKLKVPEKEALSDLQVLDEQIAPEHADRFLRYFWIVKRAAKTPPRVARIQLEREIKALGSKDALKRFSSEIEAYAQAFLDYHAKVEEPGNLHEARISALHLGGFRQHVPIMMKFLRDPKSAADNDGWDDMLTCLEAVFLHHNVLLDKSPSDIEDLLAEACGKDSLRAAATYIATKYEGDILGTTDIAEDAKFAIAFAAASWENSHAHFVLRAVESRKQNDQDEFNVQLFAPAKLHVEHILPEIVTDREWPAWAKDPKTHAQCWQRLGNMTLLAGKKNVGLQNKSFAKKRAEYKKSKLWLNDSVKKHAGWTKAILIKRGEDLAEEAAKLWSWPSVNARLADKPKGKGARSKKHAARKARPRKAT